MKAALAAPAAIDDESAHRAMNPEKARDKKSRLVVLRVKIQPRLMLRLEAAAEAETIRREESVKKSDIVRAAVQAWLGLHEAGLRAQQRLADE